MLILEGSNKNIIRKTNLRIVKIVRNVIVSLIRDPQSQFETGVKRKSVNLDEETNGNSEILFLNLPTRFLNSSLMAKQGLCQCILVVTSLFFLAKFFITMHFKKCFLTNIY